MIVLLLRPEKGDFCEGYKRLGMNIRFGKNQKSCAGKRDFCEGYKRLGQGHIRLGIFSEVKSGFSKKPFTN